MARLDRAFVRDTSWHLLVNADFVPLYNDDDLDMVRVYRWRRGVVVSGVRRMNEVNARRARLVLGDRLRARIPFQYVTS